MARHAGESALVAVSAPDGGLELDAGTTYILYIHATEAVTGTDVSD